MAWGVGFVGVHPHPNPPPKGEGILWLGDGDCMVGGREMVIGLYCMVGVGREMGMGLYGWGRA